MSRPKESKARRPKPTARSGFWVLEGLEHVAHAAGRVQVNLVVGGPDRLAGRAVSRGPSACVARKRGEEPEQKAEERPREEHRDDVAAPHGGPAWRERMGRPGGVATHTRMRTGAVMAR